MSPTNPRRPFARTIPFHPRYLRRRFVPDRRPSAQRLAELRERVQSDTYEVDPEAVAAAILSNRWRRDSALGG